MKKNPFISIVTPILNCEKYVLECIQSIEIQNFDSYEHVFVDGGSTDRSLSIIENSEGYKNGKIKLHSAPNTNACQAWNFGIKYTNGLFIGWLGADDRAKCDSFKNLAHAHKESPSKQFIYGDADILDSEGKIVGRYATKDFNLKKMVGAPCNFAAAVSVFINKDLITKVGKLRTDVNACDFDFFLRCCSIEKPLRSNYTFSEYRIHDKGISGSIGSNIYPREFFKIARSHGAGFLSPAAKNFYWHIFKQNFLSNIFYYFYNKNIRRRFHKYINEVKSPVIFGASITGKACYDYLISVKKSVKCFIDNDPPHSGTYQRLPVYRPDVFLNKVNFTGVIVLASGKSNSTMKSQLKKMNFKGQILEWLDAPS